VSTADVPIEWLALTSPGGDPSDWEIGDVVTIDFQLHSPTVPFSLFLAQGGTLIPGSPVITGTSANPWTGRVTFTVLTATEGRMFGAMLADNAGATVEINVPAPAATFTFDPEEPIQVMIVSDSAPVAFDGTLTARFTHSAVVSAVV